jgi:hypothetical protein
LKQPLQLSVADVASGDQEQFVRLVAQQEQIHKVLILGDDYSLLAYGQLVNRGISRAIPCG